MCGCKIKATKMARVGKIDIDFEELAIMGAAGLAAKAITNPLVKAIFKEKKTKWSPLIIKAGLAVGLHMVKDPTAQTAKKGVALAALFEAGDILYPKVFNPVHDSLVKKAKAAGIAVSGYGDDEEGDDDEVSENVTIDLNSADYEVSGYTDEYNEVAGVEHDDVL
jgi:ABC-type phosphate transport system substrate-binding protein